MAKAVKLIFKELTSSDFYYINQPGSTGGGKQSYIDFDTSDISANDWQSFFSGAGDAGHATGGPFWTFSVNNLGTNSVQTGVKVGQRRSTSYSIRSQKLPEHSGSGARLFAWSPHYTSFPALPPNIASAENVPAALTKDLRIFLIRDEHGKFWAGFTRAAASTVTDPTLLQMYTAKAGMINLGGQYEIDPTSPSWPFVPAGQNQTSSQTAPTQAGQAGGAGTSGTSGVPTSSDENVAEQEADDDEEEWDLNDELDVPEPGITYSIQNIRKRDRKAAKKIRNLYSKCQITGDEFLFTKKDGSPYLEVHHLIPLGAGGADSYHNMVVLSAQAHKMLHHAIVSPIDLSLISGGKLPITINGDAYTITWNQQHSAIVAAHNPSSTV